MKRTYILLISFYIFLIILSLKVSCEYLIITYPTTNLQIINRDIKQLQKQGFHPELKTKNWESKSFYYIILGRYDSYEIASKVLSNLQNINIPFEILSGRDEEFNYELATNDEILSVLQEDKKITGILKLNAKQIKISDIDEPKIEVSAGRKREEENNQIYESSIEEKSIRKKISEIAWELRKDGYRVDTEMGSRDNSILVGIYNSISSANDMKREMESYGYKTRIKEEGKKDKTLFYVYVIKDESGENRENRKEKLQKIPAKRLDWKK